jgi:hypothetical protein
MSDDGNDKPDPEQAAENSELIADVIMANDENTACIATPKDGAVGDYEQRVYQLDLLKWAVEKAEKMGWEKVCLYTKEDRPVFLRSDGDDVDTSIVVYPWLLEEQED